MKLNASNVPLEIAPLIPMAEQWGIGDDYDREAAVKVATPEQLRALVNCLNLIDQKTLFDWLAGAESYNQNPTSEYVAITCLTMAIDSARLKLSREQPR